MLRYCFESLFGFAARFTITSFFFVLRKFAPTLYGFRTANYLVIDAKRVGVNSTDKFKLSILNAMLENDPAKRS